MEAIKRTGADAVHPGYGFLSENQAFASAVSNAGAAFVGPPAHAIQAMGDKVESKRFAHAAGVHTIPGWVGVVEGADHAVAVAKDIGFPVMVKASAGGGGKGMRIAWDERDLRQGYELATQEAASAFGDSRMLIEKYVVRPRHIEFQVLGDKHGNVLYLPERECSIQRRNQKVIEEAPSPAVDSALREAMGSQAVALCQAVGYFSAGTCEFLVDQDKNFYFLEMNTRLQVEHPITEAVTGLDLVEQMLLVASGQKLQLKQDDVAHPHGWAMECRVYAEDPARGFLPSIGKLKHYIEPKGHGVRVDSGVDEGSDISIFYDPMISKLVTYGPDREIARQKAAHALDSYIIRGVQHNAPLLRSVLDHPDFVAGSISTAFLAEHFPTAESSAPLHLPLTKKQESDVIVLAASLQYWRELRIHRSGPDSRFLDSTGVPSTMSSPSGKTDLVITSADGSQTNVRVGMANPDMVSRSDRSNLGVLTPCLEVELPDRIVTVSRIWGDRNHSEVASLLVEAALDDSETQCQIIQRGPRHILLQYCGAHRLLRIDAPSVAALQQYMLPPHQEDLTKVVRSPMPGLLVHLAVSAGSEVEEGDEIAVVEAMKMRNVLKAPSSGRVTDVCAVEGSNVAADEVIARLD